MRATDSPLFTQQYVSSETLPFSERGMILGASTEDRFIKELVPEASGIRFMHIRESEENTFAFFGTSEGERRISLRDPEGLADTIRDFSTKVDIDITSIPTHILGPLIKTCWHLDVDFRGVYIEPVSYSRNATPTEGQLFDLSERISGIAPIPGFSRIALDDGDNWLFVPFLGFEGARFSHIVESIDPDPTTIYPIIGIPGFKPDYPFSTYLGNKNMILDSRCWFNVRYSRANCPFSAYYTLETLSAARSDSRLRIAPIGTKPHGLGAVLYCLHNPEGAELVYDFPIKKTKRTRGVSLISIYDLKRFKDQRLSRS